ncbi:MAG: hypothetical protein ACKO21_07640 [Nodosilinea sp.]
MLATRLYQSLTDPPTRRSVRFWLGLSLLVSLLYSLPALLEAFRSPYVIQDDARQHVFWMRRFLDPELFPADLIADYFQAVAPWGYSSFYRLFALLGLDPVTLNKLLPTLLGLITTGFCFRVGMQLLPLPLAGFAASTLLNQNLWMRDDLSSATPGAFFYPIFLAFLDALLRQRLIACVITIALEGLFYPQAVFLSAGILLLRLIDWKLGWRKPRWNRTHLGLSAAGLGMAAVVIGLYALKSSAFGPVIDAEQARTLPAFSPTGWSAFFSENPVDFWLCGKRSGMIPSEWCELGKNQQDRPQLWLTLLRLPQLWLGPGLPLLLRRRSSRTIAKRVNVEILWQGVLVSAILFFLAHQFIFRLHLPNRYTEHSFRIFLALTAGISLMILWQRGFTALEQVLEQRLAAKRATPFSPTQTGPTQTGPTNRWLLGFTGLVGLLLVFYPYSLKIDHEPFPINGYFVGKQPALYEFFAQQPKDTVIASLSPEASQIPTFSRRSLLVGGEGYLLPYHPQYFQPMSQRLLNLLQAQYSPDWSQVQSFIRDNRVDFWLLDRDSFQPDFADPKAYLTAIFAQFPDQTASLKTALQARQVPALATVNNRCTALQTNGFRVLRARCLLRQ